MVWNAMLDKTHRCGKKRGKNILVVQPDQHGKRWMLHSLLAFPSTSKNTKNTNFTFMSSNIKKHEFPRIFQKLWYRCVKLQGHLLPVFIPFFPHLQVFLWSDAFPNCHSARPFLFLLSFLSSEAIFLFYSFHHTRHRIYHIQFVLICEICTDLWDLYSCDLWDLYRFVRFDFRFARRPMVLPDRAPFYIRLRRRFFSRFARNLSNLFKSFKSCCLEWFVWFVPICKISARQGTLF